MKSSKLREMTPEELKIKHDELLEVMFRYRFQAAMGQLDNPLKMRKTRRDIARIKTIMNERLSQANKI